MSRLFVIPIVALVSVLVPSVGRAQYAVVSPCGDGCAAISVIPAPPTGVPAWLQPTPAAPPVYVTPPPMFPLLPLYVAPPAPRARGLDPWIPLAVRPAPVAPAGDSLYQLLLLEAVAAAREHRQTLPAPVVAAPPPTRVLGENWMSAFMKGVN